MTVRTPHFLLFSESRRPRNMASAGPGEPGRWRFVLESLDEGDRIEAADAEPKAEADRLDLLAVVRGLEALDQPSRVTLVTASRYVTRGLRHGLAQWRETNWQWERFGEMAPISNSDLWRRVDRALKFHELHCRTWRFDDAHPAPGETAGAAPAESSGKDVPRKPAQSTRSSRPGQRPRRWLKLRKCFGLR